ARRLEQWQGVGAPVCFLLGGPDGLAPAVLEQARERWCLSPLTLPHGLARIVVAEALYRAWSLLEQRPYHRPYPRNGVRPGLVSGRDPGFWRPRCQAGTGIAGRQNPGSRPDT